METSCLPSLYFDCWANGVVAYVTADGSPSSLTTQLLHRHTVVKSNSLPPFEAVSGVSADNGMNDS